MNEKKVAVCISGALRGSFDELKSIKTNIIDPLNADVYFSTWDCYYKWPGMYADENFVWRTFGSEASYLIPKEFSKLNVFSKIFPETVEFTKQIIVSDLPMDVIKSIITPKKINVCSQKDFELFVSDFKLLEHSMLCINQLKMFYLMYVCNSCMTGSEVEFNNKYDYVIKIRPDVKINKMINSTILNTILPNSVLVDLASYGMQDQVFACHSDTMNRICSIWLEMVRTKRLSFFKDFLNARSHVLLGLWCAKNQISLNPSYNWGRVMNSNSFNSIPDLRKYLSNDYQKLKDVQIKNSVTPFYEYLMKKLSERY